MHEDGCEKEIYEGATCTCDLIRRYGIDTAEDAAAEAGLAAMEGYEGPALDGGDLDG